LTYQDKFIGLYSNFRSLSELDIHSRLRDGIRVRLSEPLMPTSTVENYLKTILHLDEDADTAVSVGAIAETLAVTPGTVSSMMRHLADDGLVEYFPRRSVALLPKGRNQAMQVVRRHRLIETFLVEVLKLDWSEVHEEAEVLEHVISDRLLRRMDEMLGHPELDPHGDPIPNEKGEYASDFEGQPLAGLEGGRFRLVRVDDSDPELLDWLREAELLPGGEYEVVSHDTVAGILEISGKSSPIIRMGEKAARQVLVQPIR